MMWAMFFIKLLISNSYTMKNYTQNKIIILLFQILFFTTSSIYASPKDLLINLEFKNVNLSTILNETGKQTSLSIIYNVKDVNPYHSITIIANNEKLESVLSKVLNGTEISYSIKEKYLVLYRSDKSFYNQQNDGKIWSSN